MFKHSQFWISFNYKKKKICMPQLKKKSKNTAVFPTFRHLDLLWWFHCPPPPQGPVIGKWTLLDPDGEVALCFMVDIIIT